MQHHASGVNHSAERRRGERTESTVNARFGGWAMGSARADLAAHFVERPPDLCHQHMPRNTRRGDASGEFMHRGQVTQLIVGARGQTHLLDGTEREGGASNHPKTHRECYDA